MLHRLLCAWPPILLFLAASMTVAAQAAAEVHRIGILCPVSCETSDVRAFRDALARLGYKEGENIAFDYRSADGKLKRLPELAGDLVQRHVDVIVTTFGTAAGLVAKRATASIPIVVGSAGDLVAAGIVESLNRPGGNVTGITSLALELEGKRLEFLKELRPAMKRAAFFRDTANPYSVLAIKEQRAAADRLGVELREIQVHEADDIDQAFARIADERLKALCVDGYIPLLAGRSRIVALAAKNGVVAIYPLRDFVEAGGLLSYGSNLSDNAKRAADDVGKILAGASPAGLPVQQSTTVELVVNMRTAKALGLTVPRSILARADEVIE